MTITEFLEARIAEDEAVARGAYDDPFLSTVDDGAWEANTSSASASVEGKAYLRIYDDEDHGHFLTYGQSAHIARHDPARVLAECVAKRAIINNSADAQPGYMDDPHWNGFNDCHESALYSLAAVHKDHPDYKAEWVL